ncbi:hypothetical protein LCGC14_2685950 [marine sediment metagenome]|uniref:Uncharacterized protein n=1 Tax=marine sediment metagenome TaxID=412755 RepID=A0A0F9BUN2_9ZZZZ
MENKKLTYHLVSIVRLYLYELQEIYYYQEDTHKFFTKTYSINLDKDGPWYEIFKDMDKRSLAKRDDQLFKMIIVSCLSIFEAFNKDFFKILYSLRPENLKRKAKVDLNFEELIEFSSMEVLFEELAMREVDQFGRLSIDQIAKELEKKHKINLTKDFKKWKPLRENYYRRNIIVHNRGKMSKDYIEKFEDNQVNNIGKELDLSFDYVEGCISNVWDYIKFILKKLGVKYKLKIDYQKIDDFDLPLSFLFGMDPRSPEWDSFKKEIE